MENPQKPEKNDQVSTSQAAFLPFDPADLVSMRVRPADFARMCKVSREAVSKWIKKGVITLGPDGLLDPVKASREVFAKTDPARLRARIFRDSAKDVDELRAQFKQAQADLATTRAELADLQSRLRHFEHSDTIHARLSRFVTAIAEHATSLTADDLDVLAGRYFYEFSDEVMAETYGEAWAKRPFDQGDDLSSLEPKLA